MFRDEHSNFSQTYNYRFFGWRKREKTIKGRKWIIPDTILFWGTGSVIVNPILTANIFEMGKFHMKSDKLFYKKDSERVTSRSIGHRPMDANCAKMIPRQRVWSTPLNWIEGWLRESSGECVYSVIPATIGWSISLLKVHGPMVYLVISVTRGGCPGLWDVAPSGHEKCRNQILNMNRTLTWNG